MNRDLEYTINCDRYTIRASINGRWMYQTGADANDWSADATKAAKFPLAIAERRTAYLSGMGYQQVRFRRVA